MVSKFMLISELDLENVLGKPSKSFVFKESHILFSTDSRTIKKGDIFFALQGENFDGHDYIEKIIQKKEVRAVVACESKKESLEEMLLEVPFFFVKDSKQSLLDLAHWYQSLFDCKKIIVTGSNGKTTVKNCLSFALQEVLGKGFILSTPASFNNKIGVSKSLLGLREQHQIAVFEIGTNHTGEIKPLFDAINPHFAILTNIGESHLESFKTLENVYLEKTSFLPFFKGTLVINGDDSFLRKIKRKDFKIISVGLKNQNQNFKVKAISYDAFQRASFNLNHFFIKSNLSGEHQIINKLLVFALCSALNLSLEQVSKALSDFVSDGIRNQLLKIKGATILNDCYNANPSSMKKSIEILALSKIKGRKFAVLGAMEELGEMCLKKHFEVGEYIASQAIDYLICIGKSQSVEQYCLGAISKKMPKRSVFKYETIDSAVSKVKDLLDLEDMILVKASRSPSLEKFAEKLNFN